MLRNWVQRIGSAKVSDPFEELYEEMRAETEAVVEEAISQQLSSSED